MNNDEPTEVFLIGGQTVYLNDPYELVVESWLNDDDESMDDGYFLAKTANYYPIVIRRSAIVAVV